MTWLLLAVGLVMIVEGLAYALAPSLVIRMLEVLRAMPEAALRQVGLLAMVIGVLLVWIAAQFGAF
jgi:uncharacterized protein YjeT (DUF2065 family)